MESIKISRAKFVLFFTVILFGLVSAIYYFLKNAISKRNFTGEQKGANYKAGHLLHKDFDVPTGKVSISETDVLIVGGGISGLSAAYWLSEHSDLKVTLLDLDKQLGGNAQSGQDKTSKYPWGAHYLPIPDIQNAELLDFLSKAGVITGYDDKGLPIYNEEYLCHEPEERLYINGKWQKGLIPSFGVPKNEVAQINKFFELIDFYKSKKGIDGLSWFCIPIYKSSKDPEVLALDKMSFFDFLKQKGFSSTYLFWYVDYCCRDDFGLDAANCSAWAGLHYFAARGGQASNLDGVGLLTWPEGNAWLAAKLATFIKGQKLSDSLVQRIELNNNQVVAYYKDLQSDEVKKVNAKFCVLASPNYVNRKILNHTEFLERDHSFLEYSSWLVANIQLSGLPGSYGENLSWDNVIYGSSSLGYVWAESQKISVFPANNTNITLYMTYSDDANQSDRIKALTSSYDQQVALVMKELKKAHPEIEPYIDKIDTWIWGHGMVAPKPNCIWNKERVLLSQSIESKIHFAHSDLSGISIFEEAFYQGINAAKEIIRVHA